MAPISFSLRDIYRDIYLHYKVDNLTHADQIKTFLSWPLSFVSFLITDEINTKSQVENCLKLKIRVF